MIVRCNSNVQLLIDLVLTSSIFSMTSIEVESSEAHSVQPSICYDVHITAFTPVTPRRFLLPGS